MTCFLGVCVGKYGCFKYRRDATDLSQCFPHKVQRYVFYLSFLYFLAWNAGSPTSAPAPSFIKFVEPRATTCNAHNYYRVAKPDKMYFVTLPGLQVCF